MVYLVLLVCSILFIMVLVSPFKSYIQIVVSYFKSILSNIFGLLPVLFWVTFVTSLVTWAQIFFLFNIFFIILNDDYNLTMTPLFIDLSLKYLCFTMTDYENEHNSICNWFNVSYVHLINNVYTIKQYSIEHFNRLPLANKTNIVNTTFQLQLHNVKGSKSGSVWTK